MQQEKMGGAKDFFLHLGLIVSLYATAIAFVNLLFEIINTKFPKLDEYYYNFYNSGSSASMPIATLIVAFPLFLYFSHLIYKNYTNRSEIKIRKWLLYITLFIAGIIFAGDLITILFYFIDGRDLTNAFLLKSLTIFVVSGMVFKYYLKDLKDRVGKGARKKWTILVSILVVLGIVLGFSVIGSPQTQQLVRMDNQKIQNLETIQFEIDNFYEVNDRLPNILEDLKTNVTLIDKETGETYPYKILSATSYEICANFNLATKETKNKEAILKNPWVHGKGPSCFVRDVNELKEKPLPFDRPISF